MTLRYRKDGAHTWSNNYDRSFGLAGEYKHRVRYSRMGKARDMVYELSCADPVPCRVVDAYLNPRGMPETVMPVQSIGPLMVDSPFQSPETSSGSGISWPWLQWLGSLLTVANACVQVGTVIPSSSNYPGTPGMVAYDGNYFYICISQNKWLRTPLNSF